MSEQVSSEMSGITKLHPPGVRLQLEAAGAIPGIGGSPADAERNKIGRRFRFQAKMPSWIPNTNL